MTSHDDESRADDTPAESADEFASERNLLLQRARGEALRMQLAAHEDAERVHNEAQRLHSAAQAQHDLRIAEAEEAAAVTRANAESAAADRLRSAEQEANEIRLQTLREIDEMRAEAPRAVARRVKEAEAEAFHVRRVAQTQARAIRLSARQSLLGAEAQIQELQESLVRLVSGGQQLLNSLEVASRSILEALDDDEDFSETGSDLSELLEARGDGTDHSDPPGWGEQSSSRQPGDDHD